MLAHWRRWTGWLNGLILWPIVAARVVPLYQLQLAVGNVNGLKGAMWRTGW